MPISLAPQKANLKVSISPENMIELVLGGNISADNILDLKKWSEEVMMAMVKVSKENNGKVLTTIDISTLNEFDEDTLKVIKDLMVFNKKYATKTATYGGSNVSVMAQDALAILVGRDNLRAFRSKDEALAWLKENK